MKKFIQYAIVCAAACVTLNTWAGDDEEESPTARVPDTGNAAVLLAAGLGALALFRRK